MDERGAVALARARDWARTVTRVLVQLDITLGPQGALVQSFALFGLGRIRHAFMLVEANLPLNSQICTSHEGLYVCWPFESGIS